jgi:hypothetical protein
VCEGSTGGGGGKREEGVRGRTTTGERSARWHRERERGQEGVRSPSLLLLPTRRARVATAVRARAQLVDGALGQAELTISIAPSPGEAARARSREGRAANSVREESVFVRASQSAGAESSFYARKPKR